MHAYITYRKDLYDAEHDKHTIRDRMIDISYDTFSLYRIQKDIDKYMKDDELVINVVFMYDLPFFDDNVTEEDLCYSRKVILKWRNKK